MVGKVDSPTSPDREIAGVAATQHGILTTAQLVACGLSRAAISKRAQGGRLFSVHRGVYALGHSALSVEARWHAAVLASGPGAVLSHGSGAALWGLLRPVDGPIDVSVPSQAGRARRRGIRLHRCASLAHASLVIPGPGASAEEPLPATTRRDGIPVTAPWRTLEDLRGTVAPKLYRHAVRQAELRRFALPPTTPRDRTRSDVERDFLGLCRRQRLPRPQVNLPIRRWTVDFVWAAERLAVEVDSWATHGASIAFEDDHARDLELRRCGFTVCRYTETQVYEQPRLVAADLRERLSRTSEPGRLATGLDV
jgi:very-short-patch-repair endonuclease